MEHAFMESVWNLKCAWTLQSPKEEIMRRRVKKWASGGILVSLLALVFLITLAEPALSHRRVVRRYYHGHRHYAVYHRSGYWTHYPFTTIHRYHSHRGYDCRYMGGYWYHPVYGRHYHGQVGFGVQVVF